MIFPSQKSYDHNKFLIENKIIFLIITNIENWNLFQKLSISLNIEIILKSFKRLFENFKKLC